MIDNGRQNSLRQQTVSGMMMVNANDACLLRVGPNTTLEDTEHILQPIPGSGNSFGESR